ncbi:hypothetical protein CRUP_011534, partial [Coryphaenoides rupestris]
ADQHHLGRLGHVKDALGPETRVFPAQVRRAPRGEEATEDPRHRETHPGGDDRDWQGEDAGVRRLRQGGGPGAVRHHLPAVRLPECSRHRCQRVAERLDQRHQYQPDPGGRQHA